VDKRAEVSAFLKSRRDKITPGQAGLPVYGNRRVSGLRRGEVAMLAGVSVEYYRRLERGTSAVSPIASWTRSPVPCGWMMRSEPTCTTWPVLLTRRSRP
jgi:hypothetical protein